MCCHVLHLVSGDVDTALADLKEGALEGRPEAYNTAVGKLGVLWRVKRNSSQASMVLVVPIRYITYVSRHLSLAKFVFWGIIANLSFSWINSPKLAKDKFSEKISVLGSCLLACFCSSAYGNVVFSYLF